MKKPQVSARLSGEALRVLKRRVVRLTLNPALLALSNQCVDWSGREGYSGKLRPSELLLKAHARFPDLPLSWAVEGYIALLARGEPVSLEPLVAEPYPTLPESARRFRALSPSQKIRLGERWKREMQLLRRAR